MEKKRGMLTVSTFTAPQPRELSPEQHREAASAFVWENLPGSKLGITVSVRQVGKPPRLFVNGRPIKP
jgi:hypothetical protein